MPGANWEAAIIRAVLFTQQATPLTYDLFTPFAGEPPDQQEERPKEGIRRQSGTLDGAELRTSLSPVMAELVLVPPPQSAEQLFGEFSHTTGELKAQLAKFEHRLQLWLSKWEVPTIRVSLLVQALASAPSKTVAYEILRDNLTSVNVKPGEMSDLIFRINWKAKTAATAEGYFNRVMTWSAVQFRASAMSASGAGEIQLNTRNYAQVDMDLNSPGEHREALPRDHLGTIYSGLFQLAVEIADRGEQS